MKATIHSICPNARIVDITHLIEKFDIRMGAFILASSVKYFPAGTVHVAVVDPGVGSERRPLVIETKRAVLIGPDNGLLIPAAEQLGMLHAYELRNADMMRRTVSATFHGRDIFAPAAAYIASGARLVESGPEIQDYVRATFSSPRLERNAIACEVFYVDGFGNVITNISETDLTKLGLHVGSRIGISVGGKKFSSRIVNTYSDLKREELGVLVSSHGFVEIAMKEKSAAKRLRVRSGRAVRVSGVRDHH